MVHAFLPIHYRRESHVDRTHVQNGGLPCWLYCFRCSLDVLSCWQSPSPLHPVLLPMRPPNRMTRSKSSLTLSPPLAERPCTTLTDLTLRPRRRLRDNISSRCASKVESATSGRGHRPSTTGRSASSCPNRAHTTLGRLTPGHQITPCHETDPDDIDDTVDDDTYEESFTDSLSPLPKRQISPESKFRPWSRAQRRDVFAFFNEVNKDSPSTRTGTNHVPQRLDTQSVPLECLDSASGSALTSPSDPESAARRYTAQEKGKGRAAIASPVTVEDEDGDQDESIQVTGMRITDKRGRRSSEVVEVQDGGGLAGDEERSLGSFSEIWWRSGMRRS